MTSVAVISDIHGNITALEAVLKDINDRGINYIFCLGDLVGKGPNSSRAVEKIREVCQVVIQGNWDDFIKMPTDNSEIKWHQEQLGEDNIKYLSALPFHHDFYMSGKYIRLFHASAKSVHHRVVPMVHPIEEKLAMFETTDHIVPLEEGKTPDIIGFGDIHAALVEPINPKRTLFNTGSVGNPLDIPLASYVILHGEYESKEEAAFSIEMTRVPYDIEKEIMIAEQMGLPSLEAYALELREAIYRGSVKATAK